MVVLGTFILAFGWFGFNPGSTLSGTDLRIAFVVVNTMLASVSSAFAAMAWMMFVRGMKPDTSMLCNGMLAGLVAITAPCAFVDPLGRGGDRSGRRSAGRRERFLLGKLGIDDVVGAISVHGVNGIWGVISVGLFANGAYGAGWNGVARPEMVAKYGADGVRGLLYGDASQLWAQMLDSAVVCVFGFTMAYVWFKVSNLITPIRVSEETELEGLDGPEMGCVGYPEFVIKGHPTNPP